MTKTAIISMDCSSDRHSVSALFEEVTLLRERLESERKRNCELMKAEERSESELTKAKEAIRQLEDENNHLRGNVTTSIPLTGKATAPPLPGSGKACPPLPMAKGKAPPPPPPKASAPPVRAPPPPATATAPPSAANNDFVNVHWKGGSGSLPEISFDNDPFVRPLYIFAKEAGFPPPPPSAGEAHGFFLDNSALVPEEALRAFFTKKNAKIQLGGAGGEGEGGGGKVKNSALDSERQKLVGLALGGTLGSRSNRKISFREYREAILRCDFGILTPSVLCPLLQLLRTVTDDELKAVGEAVACKNNSPESPTAQVLFELEECDLFLYEMGRIPQVRTRLECLIFMQSFPELFSQTSENMEILKSALAAVQRRRQALGIFFQLALEVGNCLNKGSRAPVIKNVALGGLSKLAEVRSSADPRITLVHFILAFLDHTEFFNESEISSLRKASALRTHRVRDEVKDLLESVSAVRQQGDRRGEKFCEVANAFWEDVKEQVGSLAAESLQVFSVYREISNFLQDAKILYPPPKEKGGEGIDLFEWMLSFALLVKTSKKDNEKWGIQKKVHNEGKPENDQLQNKVSATSTPGAPLSLTKIPEKENSLRQSHVKEESVKPVQVVEQSNTTPPVTCLIQPSLIDTRELFSMASKIPSPATLSVPPLVISDDFFGERISLETPPGGFRDVAPSARSSTKNSVRSSTIAGPEKQGLTFRRISQAPPLPRRTSWYTAKRLEPNSNILPLSSGPSSIEDQSPTFRAKESIARPSLSSARRSTQGGLLINGKLALLAICALIMLWVQISIL